MKLPSLDTAVYPAGKTITPGQHDLISSTGIIPSGIFDDILGTVKDVVVGGIGKIPCILSKAGPKGVSCLTECGPNPGCLAACAGPTLVSSIMSCL